MKNSVLKKEALHFRTLNIKKGIGDSSTGCLTVAGDAADWITFPLYLNNRNTRTPGNMKYYLVRLAVVAGRFWF